MPHNQWSAKVVYVSECMSGVSNVVYEDTPCRQGRTKTREAGLDEGTVETRMVH